MRATNGCRTTMRAMGGGVAVAALALAGSAAAGGATPGAPPGALPGGGPIRPNQVFGALVNGSNGSAGPAVIRVGCGGPAVAGSTGHPLRGQSVTVFRPEVITGSFGNTGPDGREIGAFFGPTPPAAPAAGADGPVIFHRYVTKAIPTAEVLPCTGTGQVTFVPLPLSPAKDAVVPVRYVPTV